MSTMRKKQMLRTFIQMVFVGTDFVNIHDIVVQDHFDERAIFLELGNQEENFFKIFIACAGSAPQNHGCNEHLSLNDRGLIVANPSVSLTELKSMLTHKITR